MIILFISFYLDSILTLYFKAPLLTLSSIILIYPYIKDIKNYYIMCFILGLLYDITYTDTLLLNASMFLIFGYIIDKIYIFFTNNLLNINIISIIVIIIYRFLTYLILLFINYIRPNALLLLNSIFKSFIINLIYISLCYFILKKVIKKKDKHIIY